MKKELNPYISIMSIETIDAGLFIKVRGVLKNKLKAPIPVIRYQVEVKNESGRILGYQIGEIFNVKPLEVRQFEIPANYDGAKTVEIIHIAGFKK